MGKYRGHDRNRSQYSKRRDNSYDTELNSLREQQQYYHQAAQNNADQNHRYSPKMRIAVLLENGVSFGGTAVMFGNPNIPKCKVFFKGENRQELSTVMDVGIPGIDPGILQLEINNQLTALHEEAVMEFPEWLEKHSTRVNEINPYFNLDEIREEFKYKKSRFGIWRIAAQVGFFDDMRPQSAKFNRIMHLEIQEMDMERFN
jgi:hypothetical protein